VSQVTVGMGMAMNKMLVEILPPLVPLAETFVKTCPKESRVLKPILLGEK